MQKAPRDMLLDAATVLFAERGYGAVSFKEIYTAANIAAELAATLFQNEEELYAAALERQFGFYVTWMQSALEGDKSPALKVEQFATAICDLHRETPFFFPLFYRELLNPSPYFETIVKKNIRRVAYLSDNNLAKGIQKGLFKYEINPANATMLLLGMFHYNFLASRLHTTLLPEPGNDAEYLDQALKVFLTGIKNQ